MTILTKYAVAIMLLFCQILFSQDLQGSYSGTLQVKDSQMELIFNISSTNDEYKATLDVPAQGATGIELDSVNLQHNQLTISSVKLKMTYKGTLSEDGIKGTYEQMGEQYPLHLKKTIKKKPGNTTLPSSESTLSTLASKETGTYKYSVEDYFKTPEAYSFKLSPDGKFISYLKRRESGERDLYIKETATQKERLLIKQ